MFNYCKKYIYHWITNQRNKVLGKYLYSINNILYEALENKNNDFFTNGEKWLIDSLLLNNKSIVFDVGANIGDWSKLVNSKFREVNIHSFEPIPYVFQKLEENLVEIDNIKVNNFALGNTEGVINMNYYPSNSLFSSVFNHPLGQGKENIIQVNVVKGDYYCEFNNINEIHFLKIDVEGFESEVLFGFEKMLSERKIKMIQFEYGDLVLRSRFLLKDYFELLEKYNFSVGKLFPNYIKFTSYDYKMENFLTSNFVAVLKD